MTICEPESGGEILCIRLSGLGDIVHSLNALSLLREHRPLAHITWILEERFASLLEGHPHIDELIRVPRSSWGTSLKSPLGWVSVLPELTDLALNLRRRRFDVSIDFQSSFKSAWLVAAAGASLRVGFAPPVSRELAHLVQNRLVRVPKSGCHRIERDLALLAPLGIATRFAEAVLPHGEEHAGPIERLCSDLRRPLVVMHPGTSGSAAFKRWPPERYAEVAERLMEERGASVVVTWGPAEEALAFRLVGATGHRAVQAPRITHLQQLACVLSRADLFIGSDTGPMHMASALGQPVVVLFGPKDPVETGPYCGPSEVVTAPVECRPCTRRRCGDRRCMAEISVEQVLDAALRVLDGGGEVRAAEGLIRRPFSVGFELGRWRGQIATCYSAPEFYRFLAELAVARQAGLARPPGGPWDERVEAMVDGEVRPLLVRRHGRTGTVLQWPRCLIRSLGTRNYWRSALRLLRAALAARVPVCYMETRSPLCREQVIVAEELGGAEPLSAALRSVSDRGGLIRRLVRLLWRFHRAGHFHGDLRAASIYVDASGGLFFERLDTAWRLSWMPPVAKEVLWGMELRRLLSTLRDTLSARERADLADTYCQGMVRDAVRLRLLKWVIGPQR